MGPCKEEGPRDVPVPGPLCALSPSRSAALRTRRGGGQTGKGVAAVRARAGLEPSAPQAAGRDRDQQDPGHKHAVERGVGEGVSQNGNGRQRMPAARIEALEQSRSWARHQAGMGVGPTSTPRRQRPTESVRGVGQLVACGRIHGPGWWVMKLIPCGGFRIKARKHVNHVHPTVIARVGSPTRARALNTYEYQCLVPIHQRPLSRRRPKSRNPKCHSRLHHKSRDQAHHHQPHQPNTPPPCCRSFLAHLPLPSTFRALISPRSPTDLLFSPWRLARAPAFLRVSVPPW